MLDNENTQIMLGMLKYQAANHRLEKIWERDFSFTLTDVLADQTSNEKVTITLYCEGKSHYADAPEDRLSGEGLRYKIELTKVEKSWLIEAIKVNEEGPCFYNGFCNQIRDFKKSEMSMKDFTDWRIRYLIKIHEAEQDKGRPLTPEEDKKIEEQLEQESMF